MDGLVRRIIPSVLLLLSFSLTAFGAHGKPALVIIDMQSVFITRGGNDKAPENQEKVKEIIDSQLQAITYAREKKMPIIFLEYDDLGDTNEKLKKAAKKFIIFQKNADGAFEKYNKYKKDLVKYLEKNGIGTLIITGANGGACVMSTITGALDENYSVIAFNRGIADFNFKDFIYPYVDHYTGIQPKCKDCTFVEAPSLSDLPDALEGKLINRTAQVANKDAGKPSEDKQDGLRQNAGEQDVTKQDGSEQGTAATAAVAQ